VAGALSQRIHTGGVIVELRSVPDCPNTAAVRQTLYEVLAELALPREVTELVGDYPSPSVLIDGVDVTGAAVDAAPACRLDLPTAEHIRTALQRAMNAGSGATADTAGPSADCCAPPGDAIRIDRPRRAEQLPTGLRQLHRAILRHFATTGTAPSHTDISAAPSQMGVDPAVALTALAAEDLVAVDADGQLVAAYPFSPTPTAHTVALGGVAVFAMCAVDALGIPFMLGTDAVITSTDPHTGEPVRVTVTDGTAYYQPAEAVVVYAATGPTGRSVDTCCATINFFACPGSAQAWIAAHPSLAATVLTQEQAVALGRDIFGPLLAWPPTPHVVPPGSTT
jgi:alkylmercury lyase-like protein